MRPDASRAGTSPVARPGLVDTLRTGLVVLGGAPLLAASLVRELRWPVDETSHLAKAQQMGRRALSLLGVELECLGAERIPREGGLVFMWNQESHLDHLVLAAVMPRPVFSLYNNEVRSVPLYGEYLRRTGHVWVDRNDESQWRPAIARAATRVRAGECALVSPEGTRSPDGKLLPMKRGAFLLAEAAERPIVLVTLIGGHARLPRGAVVVRRGPLRAVFSDPIPRPAGGIERWKDAVIDGFETSQRCYALREAHAAEVT
jgi:1-acyl-sn-glycerol-3-phosphate acyltransferase